MERSPCEFPLTWEDVCNNPLLADLPYRVEINRNSQRAMEAKRADYFEAGTLECWFCDLSGAMWFYGPEGELEGSRLCPEFSRQVVI